MAMLLLPIRHLLSGACRRFVGRDERGFVLVLVLAAVAFLSVLAVAATLRLRGSAESAAVLIAAAEDRALREAATERLLWAAADSDDPLNGLGRRRRDEAVWAFGGRQVVIAAGPEAARADLNWAEPALLLGLLDRLDLAPELRGHARSVLRAARAEGRALASAASLAPPCARLSDGAAALDETFTVLTRRPSVVPGGLPEALWAAIPGLGAPEIAALRADIAAGHPVREDARLAALRDRISDGGPLTRFRIAPAEHPDRARTIVVGVAPRIVRPFLVETRETTAPADGLCG